MNFLANSKSPLKWTIIIKYFEKKLVHVGAVKEKIKIKVKSEAYLIMYCLE